MEIWEGKYHRRLSLGGRETAKREKEDSGSKELLVSEKSTGTSKRLKNS